MINVFFHYFIDPDKDLLVGIRTGKLQMIIRRKKAYLQKVEDSVKGLGVGLQVYILVQTKYDDSLI